MPNRLFKAGPSGPEPLALGAREHAPALMPASRRALRLGVLGMGAQPIHLLKRFLVYAPAAAPLPEWAELRALALETAEAA